jgi:hypothetical protein
MLPKIVKYYEKEKSKGWVFLVSKSFIKVVGFAPDVQSVHLPTLVFNARY